MRNLSNQLHYAANNNLAIGQKKHCMDKDIRHDGRSFSWASHNARIDTGKQFAGWMREHHADIKMAIDITSDHVNEFLSDKSKTCRGDTLASYASNLRAIGRQIKNTYGATKIDDRSILTPKTDRYAARTMQMADRDIEALYGSYKNDSTGANAIILARATGARAAELTRIDSRNVHFITESSAKVDIIGGKGGRDRTVDVIGCDNVKNLQEVCRMHPQGRILGDIKPDSLNRNFDRHLKKLGLRANYPLTSTHAMRKTWAQKMYDEYRKSHSKLDTIGYVNEQLGHSAERDVQLLERYVGHIY